MVTIVRIAGHQYSVKPNDTLLIDKIDGEVGSTVEFDDVLFPKDKKKQVVTAKILAHEKGEKIHIRRYKSKVRYRKHIGFRASLTKVEITAIA